jgi:hypothetical protein
VRVAAGLGDLIQLQRSGECFEDLLGHPAGVAALQAGVVLDRDAGQQGHFLAAQSRHPPVPAVDRKTSSLRADLRPPGGQELADLAADVVSSGHASEPTQARDREEVPASTPIGRDFLAPVIEGFMEVYPR